MRSICELQKEERMTTICKVLEIADTRLALVKLLDPFAIIRLAATCRRLRSILYTASSKRWNIGRWDIDAHLKRFVEDPKSFRGMLGKCRAIVSGSNAMQFLDGTCYENSDLDVYFQDLKGLVEFGDYMMEAELYLYSPDLTEQPPDWTTLRTRLEVVPYVSKMKYEGLEEVVYFSRALFGRKMQLMWSSRGPLQLVCRFDLTLVMNFFTWKAAYALFTWLTFNQRCGVVSRGRPSLSLRDKNYIGRGFRIETLYLNHPNIWKSVDGNCSPRVLKDLFTWYLPFDVDGINKPMVVDTIRLDEPFYVSTCGDVTGSTLAR